MYTEITACRICGNKELVTIFDLGVQSLTGHFVSSPLQPLTKGPVTLVKCFGSESCCGLVQLKQTYSLEEMYGAHYGYRSGLNSSMIAHLSQKVRQIETRANLVAGDLVLDIGSNDGTLLGTYQTPGLKRLGIDPSGAKFKQYYPKDAALVPAFFDSSAFKSAAGSQKAKVITSIAMFYDLPHPMQFMRDVYESLDDQGIWVFEQSYLPLMLESNSYDTICHEHLEFYSFAQIRWMAERVGFEIISAELNLVNGGSFSITAAKKGSRHLPQYAQIEPFMSRERKEQLDTLEPYVQFRRRVESHRTELLQFLDQCERRGERVVGYGASTKGNVLLQYCGIDSKKLTCIGEVNPDKFGKYTPGTLIPIVSEQDAKSRDPHVLLVLPWHFKDHFVRREQTWLSENKSRRLCFPLPHLTLIGS